MANAFNILDFAPYRVLAASGTLVSHTGNTDETALATVSMPARAMGANGILRITLLWTMSGTNTKTMRVRLGGISGTQFLNLAQTTNLGFRSQTQIHNRSSAASQVGFLANAATGAFSGTGGAGPTTGTVDTTAAQDLVITGQLTNTSESIGIESYLVELLQRP